MTDSESLEKLSNDLGQYVPPHWVNEKYTDPKWIELNSYLDSIFRLAEKDPSVVDRLIEVYGRPDNGARLL